MTISWCSSDSNFPQKTFKKPTLRYTRSVCRSLYYMPHTQTEIKPDDMQWESSTLSDSLISKMLIHLSNCV